MRSFVKIRSQYDHESWDFCEQNISNNDDVLEDASSTYVAFTARKTICAGYANALSFLCKCANINCERVSCRINDGKYVVSPDGNHAIVKLKVGGKTYYSDPTSDAVLFEQGKQPANFLRTKGQISQNRNLNYMESLEPDSVPLDKEMDFLMQNYRKNITITKTPSFGTNI